MLVIWPLRKFGVSNKNDKPFCLIYEIFMFSLAPRRNTRVSTETKPFSDFQCMINCIHSRPKGSFFLRMLGGRIYSCMLILFLPILEECKAASLQVIQVEIKLICPSYVHWNNSVMKTGQKCLAATYVDLCSWSHAQCVHR